MLAAGLETTMTIINGQQGRARIARSDLCDGTTSQKWYHGTEGLYWGRIYTAIFRASEPISLDLDRDGGIL